MKKALVILGAIAGFIVLVIVLGITFFYLHFPNVDKPSSVVVERTPERIARGKYLANHVSVCLDCHSKRDYTLFSGPIEEGTEGMGGEKFGPEMGFRSVNPHRMAWLKSTLISPRMRDLLAGERVCVSGFRRATRAVFFCR